MNNISFKYNQEQVQNRARYHGLYMFYACKFGMVGPELRDAVAYDFRKLYGSKNTAEKVKDESNN